MEHLHKKWLIPLLLCSFLYGNYANAEGFPTTPPLLGPIFTHDLSLGTRGNDVSVLQRLLIDGGYLHTPTPTGYFGPMTKTALAAWQHGAGITPAAGYFGPLTRAKMNAVLQKPQIAGTQAAVAVAAVPIPAATTSVAVANAGIGLPTRLKIPKLSVDAGFQYTGLDADGVMVIPNNITDVGWFTGSVHPGERGTAVVTGHVAQIRGGVLTKPGVFSNLNQLRAGDKLSVVNDKGLTITFVVREARSFDPAADATEVFSAKDDGAHLNLITCEGTWNADKLSYSQRLVIFTDAVP